MKRGRIIYYIHKPNGSPKSEFAGVKPTGKLPKSIDFGLIPSEEKETFTALIFGDPQPYNLEEIEYFTKGIVTEVEGIKDVPFGLSLGDLVGNDLDLFSPYIKAVKMRICVTNMTDFHGFLLENPYNRTLFGAAPEDLFTGCLA